MCRTEYPRDLMDRNGAPGRKPGFQLIVAFLILCLISAGVPVSATGSPALAPSLQVDPDTVLLEVTLQSDGSAVWHVEYRVKLDDENTTNAFESVQADVKADPDQFTGVFTDRMRRTVAAAENATDREMALSNVSVSATQRQLPQPTGVLDYSFRWEGFAVSNGTTIRAGDALEGLFLDEETTLLVTWPSDYHLVDRAPAPTERRERAVVWSGPLDFAAGEPVVVVTAAPPPTTTPSPPATNNGTERTGGETPPPGGVDGNGARDPSDGRSGDLPVAWLGVAAVLVLLGASGWILLRRRRTTTESAPDEATEEPLLSNKERVLDLLERRGGRVKQQELAAELGWTDAKTSQVVSDLRESGEIESFRLGRENVLSLPDEE